MIETRLLPAEERPILTPFFAELFQHYGEPVPDDATATSCLPIEW